MKYLLDSVILIDHFNGIADATRYLAGADGSSDFSDYPSRSADGIFPADMSLAKRLLDAFSLLDIGREAADYAAILRQEHGWKLPDAFQAALAKQHGLLLVTRNSKGFSPDKHNFVVVPYRL